MTHHILGRGACEYLPALKLLISYWPMTDFTDEEWDGYVEQIRRYSRTIADFRVLTWNVKNATPRPEQQQRMSQVGGGGRHRVALVMRERVSGFSASVLALVNPNIGTFSEEQFSEAWAHIGLTPSEMATAKRALQALREHVDTAP